MTNEETPQQERIQTAEAVAESALDELLEDPQYSFLLMPVNQEKIDSANTAVEALSQAIDLIDERLKRSFRFEALRQVEGVELVEANVAGIRSVLERIKEEQIEIGRGGDGYVVVSKNEINNYPPVICYKFAITETTPRGRNTLEGEAQMQSDFYDFANGLESSRVGVPMPFYATELGADKVFAMEKLNAKSVDDILRGMGRVPEWFDLDSFCDQLQDFFEAAHANGLYHRDMHVGNIMISQSVTEPEDGKWGHVIDFGLSGHGLEGMDPYVRERAGEKYKYSPDDAIVLEIKRKLRDYLERNRG